MFWPNFIFLLFGVDCRKISEQSAGSSETGSIFIENASNTVVKVSLESGIIH